MTCLTLEETVKSMMVGRKTKTKYIKTQLIHYLRQREIEREKKCKRSKQLEESKEEIGGFI